MIKILMTLTPTTMTAVIRMMKPKKVTQGQTPKKSERDLKRSEPILPRRPKVITKKGRDAKEAKEAIDEIGAVFASLKLTPRLFEELCVEFRKVLDSIRRSGARNPPALH
jgi:hypothetical protein